MHYYLDSPVAEGSKLTQKGQIGSMPIYHCKHSNTFWILEMVITGDRFLVKYDPETGTVDQAQRFAVPSDWSGEPQTIGIRQTTYHDLMHDDNRHNLEGIRQLIRGGDYVCLIDDANHVTHLFTLDQEGNLQTQPIRR